ncbi:MAG TPA: YfhO family protein [Longimicrobiales bacterium]
MALKTKQAKEMPRHGAADTGDPGGFLPTGWLIGSYLILAVVFFLPALMPGTMIYGSDHLGEAYFSEKFATDRLAAGELPKWNPYIFGGLPFFANAMDTYYPITVLLRLVGVPTYHLPLFIFILQSFLAGVGTFLLVRELGGRTFAAYLAGLAFMFSGYTISFILGGHDGRMIVATLAPLFFFAIHRAVRTGGLRWYVLAGVVLGGAHLSNQIQSTYYLLLAGLLWFAFLLWHLHAARPARTLANRLGGSVLALAIGFSMVAVNYLPFAAYIAHSPRGGEGGRGYEFATSWSMPPVELVGIAVPERIGIRDAYWGANPFKLHTEYVGALALLALVLGVYLLRKNRYVWFFLALGIFTLTLSFGGHTPIYRLYYALLPGTAKFRAPSISFFLFTLAVTTIAGLALDRLARLRGELASRSTASRNTASGTLRTVRNIGLAMLGLAVLWGVVAALARPELPLTQPTTLEELRAAKAALNHPAYVAGIWRFTTALAACAIAVWLWLRGTLSMRTAGIALALITVVDLWVIDKRFFETIPTPDVTLAADDIARFLSSRPGPFRVMVLPDLPQDNYLTLFGIELVGGQHANALQSYNEFLGEGEQTYTDYHNMNRPAFLALANARYLVTTRRIEAPFLKPVYEGRVRDGRTAVVYENSAVLPRAFLAARATRVDSPDGALERMQAPDFDPGREVVLYEEPPLVTTADTAAAGTARIVRYDPSDVEVAVRADRPAYLVLTDNDYDGWTATVDGEPAPVLRADHTFRAVPVPAGEHAVRFHFDPPLLAAGFMISAGVWALLAVYGLGLAIQAWRRRAARA